MAYVKKEMDSVSRATNCMSTHMQYLKTNIRLKCILLSHYEYPLVICATLKIFKCTALKCLEFFKTLGALFKFLLIFTSAAFWGIQHPHPSTAWCLVLEYISFLSVLWSSLHFGLYFYNSPGIFFQTCVFFVYQR